MTMPAFRLPITRLLLAAAFAAGLLLFNGCGPRESAADVGARDGILLLGNGTEPAGLDPHLVTGVTENSIISALMEGLILYHPTDDNLLEPGVAESWEHDGTYTEWTFQLRPDARWSNRDPVTAQDFLYSYNRMLSPELGAEYADMLHVLKNAEAFHRGEITDFSEVGVRAPDERTLILTLRGPMPYFPGMLKHYAWFPVHPPTIEAHGGMTNRVSPWTRPRNHVGNGPFTLEQWSVNRIIRVAKSPTYWDADRVRLNEIHFFPIDDANTEERAFRAGQLHYTNSIPADLIASYRRDRPELIRVEPYLGTYFYRFNVTRPPLDDARVRLALSKTIDQRQIVEQIAQGGQEPAHGYTPPGLAGYESLRMVEFNPTRARELLAEAGYPNGEGFPRRLQILFNTAEGHRRIAEAVQEMWRTHLGIQVTLTNQEWKVYLDTQTNMNYDIARAGWIGDYMDPKTFLDMWLTGAGNNNTGWSNERYDELVRASDRTADPEERFRLLRQAEEILLEERPIAPFYWYTRIYLIDPRVRGWNPKLLDNRPYKYVYFEETE
ncbi:MAG: peptide ABC transporter substrate-binding protein [Puniceicoccaceae bacterium]|nr:MAG: peptide ABC transporter substrate-binding protein [Puniceicoccaceae bacterium]